MATFTNGFDISKWQDSNTTTYRPDFSYSKRNGMKFCFIRAGQRLGIDEDFTYNWAQARANNIIHGAYYYLDWRVDHLAQMNHFWDTVNRTGDVGELPLAIDYEQRDYRPTIPVMQSRLYASLEQIKALSGRTPILYTGPSYWTEFGTSDAHWANYPLWIANYGVRNPNTPEPWKSRGGWTFWQWADRIPAKPYGMESEQLDGDFFNGTEEDLLRFCGLSVPPAVDEKAIRIDELIKAQAGFDIYVGNRLNQIG